MKKLVILTTLILLISFTVTTFAIQEQVGVGTAVTVEKTEGVTAPITNVQKNEFKRALKTYFSPVLHGYGIGFTEETYITAKWHVTQVRILNRAEINAIIREAKQGNKTDWDAVMENVRNRLSSAYTTARKGRIKIEGRNYALTNITVSDESLTADIREIPDYTACKQANLSSEDCEINSDKVGEVSITKRSKPSQEIPGEPRVWAGIMTFNDVVYTFVTFAYPR